MNTNLLRTFNTLGLVFLITINMLAVILPLGGKTTGELSDLYPNLFVPSGFTFAIWSVINILLLIFIGYQWYGKNKEDVIQKIGIWFVVNALANGLWLVFWHYEFVTTSIFLMAAIIGSLIKIYEKLDVVYFKEPSILWQVTVPISIYMGWISIATIANITVAFVATGVESLGLGADVWASIMVIVAVVLALRMLYVYKDIFFAAVVCWASYGIYSKRVADDTLMIDPKIEHTSYISIYILIVAIVLTIVYSFLKKKKTI